MQNVARLACAVCLLLPACSAVPTAVTPATPAITSAGVQGPAAAAKSDAASEAPSLDLAFDSAI